MTATVAPIFSLLYTPTAVQPIVIQQFTESVTLSSTELKYLTRLSCPTSDTVVDLSAITTLGRLFVQNVDAAHYVELGPTSAGAIVPLIKLKPGEFAWLRLSTGITLRSRANTAAVDIDLFALND